MNSKLNIPTDTLVYWFNTVRMVKDAERTRMLDAFWDTQIEAKCWLVNVLNQYVKQQGNIYIFGGWVGLLANLLFEASQFKIEKIYSIDIDPWCENISNNINLKHFNLKRFKAITADMSNFKYFWDVNPDVIINTSTEHVNQETYDLWFKTIPKNTVIALQGNNFFNCSEHIRCSNTLNEFKKMNHVKNVLYEGELPNSQYTRFMCIFEKNS